MSSLMIGSFFDWLRHRARSRRWSPDLALGRRGEDLAHRYLRRKGFKIVARNYRLPSGSAEADVIAWDGGELVFVEVKTRRSGEYGPPDRAVGEEKRAHLLRVAREYSRKTDTPWDRVRFDLVSVILSDPPQLEWLRGAFQA
ncbi:MAG TPA: YraN family protein [Bryobacteraceae bacterium]|nr:YraN family protein [Bryobacteraceae bacterium]